MRALVVIWLLSSACDRAEPSLAPNEPAPAATPAEPVVEPTSQPTSRPSDDIYEASAARPGPDGGQLYGDPLDESLEPVTLARLLSASEQYKGKVVKTSGTISRVCKAMGCWIELEDSQGTRLRAPMAGHAYFLPQSVTGKQATVEGEVGVRELTIAEKEHYKAEGARAVDVAVSIDATGVLVL